MKIVVIGSMNNQETMKSIRKFFEERIEDVTVITPLDEEFQGESLIWKRTLYISHIRDADLVVVVPKKKNETNLAESECFQDVVLGVGESTSYEIATCRYFARMVVYWG